MSESERDDVARMFADFDRMLASTFEAMRKGEPLERPSDLDEMARRVVERKRREEAMLAAMTPEERSAWLDAWARRVAEHEVEAGNELDRWLNAGGMSGRAGPFPGST